MGRLVGTKVACVGKTLLHTAGHQAQTLHRMYCCRTPDPPGVYLRPTWLVDARQANSGEAAGVSSEALRGCHDPLRWAGQ